MSLALYRKYRPATFAELKGQEHVAEPLQQALRNGRINHAYLFSGPRGCGKTSSARILARSLNCEKGPTPDPCGECDSCVALGPSGAGHLDVIEIDAASHGGVDDARDLRERAFFAPVAARYKIYIIDEAHMVTREGFNALLKLVEEPPPHLKFIFATTEPEKVIGTIRSRTHHYPFRLIPPGVLRELLESTLKAEGVPYEPNALPLVVRAGAGSARDSLSILDQLLAGADQAGITYNRAVSLLGYTDSALLDEVVDAFAARDGAAVFAAIDRVIESGQDPRRFTADLLERCRDLVILANVPETASSGLLDVPPDEMERMRKQAATMGAGDLTRAADLLHTGLTEMRGATSPRLLLELICARILLPQAYDDEASVLARLDRLERRIAMGGMPAPGDAAFAAPPPSPPPQPSAGQAYGGASASTPTRSADPSAHRPAASGSSVQDSERPGEERSAAPSRAIESTEATQTAQTGQTAQPGQTGQTVGTAEWPAPSRPQAAGAQDQPGSSSAAGPSPGSWPSAAAPATPAAPASPAAGQGGASDAGRPGGSAGGGPDAASLRQAWPELLERVKRKSRVAWMVMMEGVQVASVEGRLLTLSFANEGKRKNFTGGSRDAVLIEVLKETYGVEWRIDTVLGNGPAAGAASQRQRPAPMSQPPAGFAGAAAMAAPRSPSPGPIAPPPGPGRPDAPRPGGAGPLGSSGMPGSSGSADPPGGAAPARNGGPAPRSGMVPGDRPDSALPPLPPPPDDAPPPYDESDEVDPEGDADAGSGFETSGMALIQRELGGEIIKEIGNS